MILALGTHREAGLCSMMCGQTEQVWPWVGGPDGGPGTPAGLGLCPGLSEAFHAQESALMEEKG